MTARTICLSRAVLISVGPSEAVQPVRCLPFDDDERNIDMNGMGWARTAGGGRGTVRRTGNGSADGGGALDSRWLHSDMKDAAYFYVHPLFVNLVNTGGLK